MKLSMRTLAEADLRWFACPACRGALRLGETDVICTVCGRRYPVVDGIAVLLEGRAAQGSHGPDVPDEKR